MMALINKLSRLIKGLIQLISGLIGQLMTLIGQLIALINRCLSRCQLAKTLIPRCAIIIQDLKDSTN